MAILNLVHYPDDPLTKAATPIEKVDRLIAKLADDMIETMHAYEGVGLAGPQVGVSKRIFVLAEPDGPEMCFINPEILVAEGSQIGEEGCLSLPQIYTDVERAVFVRVRALDRTGVPFELDARDLLARIIQHELDHLDGIIFLDRVDILTREAKLQEWSELREKRAAALSGSL